MDFMDGMEQRLSDIRGITLKSLLENPSFLQPPTSNNKSNEDKDGKKDKEAGFLDGFGCGNDDVASAFLGPALWEKTPYDELKLEYMDLDEFLSENGIAVAEGKEDDEGEKSDAEQSLRSGASSPAFKQSGPRVIVEEASSLAGAMGMSMLSPTPSPPPVSPSPQTPESPEIALPPDMSPVRTPSPVHIEVPFDINETDVAPATAPGQETFNPKSCTFTDAELKPQPMIKKSRKIYVPSEQKDEKYWERRRKNNIAAKRSRDARRIKENQIVIRASYLMKENGALKGDILDLKKENTTLKKIIASYEKRLSGMNMD